MKASDLFVRCLEAEGVTHIFGVPGEENADVMISLMDSSIRFVLCRHEQAAAFAADAYGRLTGKAGVCLGTLGPGATNLVTGVADANMDRSPLVCVIGQGSTRRLHKESHQNMDSVAMFAPITKWAHTIWDAGTVPEVVRKAFKTAEAEKPGATLIEFPEDVAKEESNEPPMAAVKTRRPGADHKVVQRAVDLIAEAKRPLMLAGNGAIRKRAARQLRRFAHKTGIGVVNTFMGKGAVPMSDPHCLFTMGLQSRDYINIALDDGRSRHQRRLRPRRVRAELLEPRPVDPDHPYRLRAGRDRQSLPGGARHPGRHRRRPVADQRGAQPALRQRGPAAAVRHRGALQAARRHPRRSDHGEAATRASR